MDDLNHTTNRLRRKFDATSNYLETKVQVMDSARRINQVITKGNYGTQAERYWVALRTNIDDLARENDKALTQFLDSGWSGSAQTDAAAKAGSRAQHTQEHQECGYIRSSRTASPSR
jgi:hypothetical protein